MSSALRADLLPPVTARLVWDVGLLSFVLGCTHGLKASYSTASPEDLAFILRPTAALVELMTGSRFVEEAHVGYVSRELCTLIVPACAGINFLVIAIGMVSFTVVPRARRGLDKVLLAIVAAGVALLSTVVVNASRISLGIGLHPLTGGPDPDVHRTLGVVVYLGALWALFRAADRLTKEAA